MKNILDYTNPKIIDKLLNYDNLMINYSIKNGHPIWSGYIVKPPIIPNKRKKFIRDKLLDNEHIYQLDPRSLIFGNYWTRGHLCPGFLLNQDIKTYQMSNIIPQTRKFNTQDWVEIERITLNIIKQQKNETIIFTGCQDISSPNVWIDEKYEYKYIIPNIVYQIIIQNDKPICFMGINDNESKVNEIKLNNLENILGYKIIN
jgi:DNA/RNA endonuclease G (NUC1)